MGVALTAVSYSLYVNTEKTRHLVVILVFIFNAGFGYSWGPLPWLIPSEISPLSIRAKIASLATASNWAFNWLVGEMTPILQELITWRLYLIHSTSCFISFFVVYTVFPETAGVSLEDMDSIFDDRSSTFSFHGSTYQPIDSEAQSIADETVPGGNIHQNLSTAALARQQALANPTVDYSNPLLTKQKSEQSFRNFIPPQSQSSNFSIEPPGIEEIVKYKNSDQHSLSSSIRRSSATVSSFVGKVFKKKGNGNSTSNGDGDESVFAGSDTESLNSSNIQDQV